MYSTKNKIYPAPYILALSLLLYGCGQKGPLFLPKNTTETEPVANTIVLPESIIED